MNKEKKAKLISNIFLWLLRGYLLYVFQFAVRALYYLGIGIAVHVEQYISYDALVLVQVCSALYLFVIWISIILGVSWNLFGSMFGWKEKKENE